VLPPTTFDDYRVAPATYYDGHVSQKLNASSPRSLSSHGVGEDPTTKLVFSHATPRQQDDLSVTGAYSFGSGQSPGIGVQKETPGGTVPISRSPGEEPGRHGAIEPPPLNRPLTSLLGELSPRYEQFELYRTSLGSAVSTQSDAGPSRSMFFSAQSDAESSASMLVTSVSPCGP